MELLTQRLSKEQAPYDLLLEADPSVKRIENYLDSSYIVGAFVHKILVGVYVLKAVGFNIWEIMNISVKEQYQNKGIGEALLKHAQEVAVEKGAKYIQISTGNSSFGQLYLYQKMGFRMCSIEKDFFVQNYDEPILENGIRCFDKVVLRKEV